jgi:hypothetical protein
MPALRVSGRARRAGSLTLLTLDARLDGHDTFLRAELRIAAHAFRVRVHTFDDGTVLQADGNTPVPARWSGLLLLPPARRRSALPADLTIALTEAGLPAALDGLGDAERGHLLGYLAGAADGNRRERIAVIVASLGGCPAA